MRLKVLHQQIIDEVRVRVGMEPIADVVELREIERVTGERYAVVVECQGETEMVTLVEMLEAQGKKCLSAVREGALTRGHSRVGLCPFHKEKTPSFHVNDRRGFYHCFNCGAHGDVFRFVQETKGVDFREAVTQLAKSAGIDITEDDWKES